MARSWQLITDKGWTSVQSGRGQSPPSFWSEYICSYSLSPQTKQMFLLALPCGPEGTSPTRRDLGLGKGLHFADADGTESHMVYLWLGVAKPGQWGGTTKGTGHSEFVSRREGEGLALRRNSLELFAQVLFEGAAVRVRLTASPPAQTRGRFERKAGPEAGALHSAVSGCSGCWAGSRRSLAVVPAAGLGLGRLGGSCQSVSACREGARPGLSSSRPRGRAAWDPLTPRGLCPPPDPPFPGGEVEGGRALATTWPWSRLVPVSPGVPPVSGTCSGLVPGHCVPWGSVTRDGVTRSPGGQVRVPLIDASTPPP